MLVNETGIKGSVDGMLMVVNWLNIVLIVKLMSELTVQLVLGMVSIHVAIAKALMLNAVVLVSHPLDFSVFLIFLFDLLLL